MSDWRTGSRYGESVEYRLLNLAMKPLDVLNGVQKCTLTGSVNADIRWGGNLVWAGSTAPDWSQVLIHPWYLIDGVPIAPLCPPCFVKAPGTTYSATVPLESSLTLYDLSYTVAKRLKVGAGLSLAPGVVVTDTLATRLAAAGLRASITPSAQTVSTAMNWDPGVSEMRVLNGLLGSVGYWSIYSDFTGVMQAKPYVDPAQRAPVWAFEPGSTSILDPKRTRTLDDFDVPNRLTGVARASTDNPTPAVVTVTLDSIRPNSPYTYAKRGFWADGETLRDVDAADATALTATVTQQLLDDASVAATVAAQHAWVPEVELGSVVTRLGTRYTVQKMTVACEVGGLPTTVEWREI